MICGKVLEQIVQGAISKHMKKVTGSNQHRFTKGKSCLMNLIASTMKRLSQWKRGENWVFVLRLSTVPPTKHSLTN